MSKVWNIEECVLADVNVNILAETKEEAIEKFRMLGSEGAKKYAKLRWRNVYYLEADSFYIEEHEGDDYDVE